MSSSSAGTHVTASRKTHQRCGLAGDVFNARERLRQVDLQRVGASIVGNQTGADVDRDEEHEHLLLLQELAKCLRRRRQHRHLREVGRRVDQDRTRTRNGTQATQQQRRGRQRFAEHRSDAGARDDQPGLALRVPSAGVAPVSLIVNRHDRSIPRRRLARTRLRASARWDEDAAAAGRHAAPARTARTRRVSSGTNTRITSSSVSWHSKPASRYTAASRSVAFLGAHLEDPPARSLQHVDRTRPRRCGPCP